MPSHLLSSPGHRSLTGDGAEQQPYSTRATLLERVVDGDHHGWEDFYKQYAGLIDWFCRERAVPRLECAATRRQVVQAVMIFFSRQQFKYDPAKGRFRNYILAVAAHKVHEVLRELRPTGHEPLHSAGVEPAEVAKAERLTMQLDPQHAAHANADALAHLIRRLQVDPAVKPQHLRILSLFLEGMSAVDISRELAIDIDNLYVIKHRLITRLRTMYQDELAGDGLCPTA